VFDALSIPAVLAINGAALAAYPAIVRAAVEREWEFIGHGFTQRNMQKVANERVDIRKTRDVIAKATGRSPRGWLGPGLTETWETPDLLIEEGYDYVADWVLADQPVWLKTRTTPILNVPYTQECNDVAMMLIQHHKASEYSDRALDQFAQIYADSAKSARIMALVVHPYIMGAPHQLKYFRRVLETISKKSDVKFWTGAQIADWYKAHRSHQSLAADNGLWIPLRCTGSFHRIALTNLTYARARCAGSRRDAAGISLVEFDPRSTRGKSAQHAMANSA
jgi:allantoinase